MIRIGIDISSGEKSPKELFNSINEYALENKDELWVFLQDEILKKDPESFLGAGNVHIVSVSQNISMKDDPLKSIRKKTDSSIVKGLQLLKDKKIDLFFSPGNSGALITGAREIVGLAKDISFPAIAVTIPNIHGDVILLDAGASFLMDEDRGAELALMGKIYYEHFFDEENPGVGILNIGKEWYKGPKWVRRLDRILKKDENLNYMGFVEGFDLFVSKCRVFVTGGYTGNILLKGLEGVYSYIKTLFKDSKDMSPEALRAIRENIHYSRMGAGMVLGAKGDIFIGHGITSPEALKNALFFAKKMNKLNLNNQIEKEIRKKGFLSKLLKRRSI